MNPSIDDNEVDNNNYCNNFCYNGDSIERTKTITITTTTIEGWGSSSSNSMNDEVVDSDNIWSGGGCSSPKICQPTSTVVFSAAPESPFQKLTISTSDNKINNSNNDNDNDFPILSSPGRNNKSASSKKLVMMRSPVKRSKVSKSSSMRENNKNNNKGSNKNNNSNDDDGFDFQQRMNTVNWNHEDHTANKISISAKLQLHELSPKTKLQKFDKDEETITFSPPTFKNNSSKKSAKNEFAATFSMFDDMDTPIQEDDNESLNNINFDNTTEPEFFAVPSETPIRFTKSNTNNNNSTSKESMLLTPLKLGRSKSADDSPVCMTPWKEITTTTGTDDHNNKPRISRRASTSSGSTPLMTTDSGGSHKRVSRCASTNGSMPLPDSTTPDSSGLNKKRVSRRASTNGSMPLPESSTTPVSFDSSAAGVSKRRTPRRASSNGSIPLNTPMTPDVTAKRRAPRRTSSHGSTPLMTPGGSGGIDSTRKVPRRQSSLGSGQKMLATPKTPDSNGERRSARRSSTALTPDGRCSSPRRSSSPRRGIRRVSSQGVTPLPIVPMTPVTPDGTNAGHGERRFVRRTLSSERTMKVPMTPAPMTPAAAPLEDGGRKTPRRTPSYNATPRRFSAYAGSNTSTPPVTPDTNNRFERRHSSDGSTPSELTEDNDNNHRKTPRRHSSDGCSPAELPDSQYQQPRRTPRRMSAFASSDPFNEGISHQDGFQSNDNDWTNFDTANMSTPRKEKKSNSFSRRGTSSPRDLGLVREEAANIHHNEQTTTDAVVVAAPLPNGKKKKKEVHPPSSTYSSSSSKDEGNRTRRTKSRNKVGRNNQKSTNSNQEFLNHSFNMSFGSNSSFSGSESSKKLSYEDSFPDVWNMSFSGVQGFGFACSTTSASTPSSKDHHNMPSFEEELQLVLEEEETNADSPSLLPEEEEEETVFSSPSMTSVSGPSRIYEYAKHFRWNEVAYECKANPWMAKYVGEDDGMTALHLAVMSRANPLLRDGKAGSTRPASLDLIEKLIVACPEAAIIRCKEKRYTPLMYACIVTEKDFNMEDSSQMIKIILKHAPHCALVFTDEGYSALDVHIITYSLLHRQKAEVYCSAGRGSTVVLRTLLEENPSLAAARPYGDRLRGPVELLYRCNIKEFKGATAEDIASACQGKQSNKGSHNSVGSSVSALHDWWAWRWTNMLLKAASIADEDDEVPFFAVHAASQIVGCPVPVLCLAIDAHLDQVQKRSLRDGTHNCPLHEVCSWVTDEVMIDGDPFVQKRKGKAIAILLDAFPKAARMTNNMGETPLNLAIETCTPWGKGLEMITKVFPRALMIPRSIDHLRDGSPLSTAIAYHDEDVGSVGSDEDEWAAENIDAIQGMYPFMVAAALSHVSKRRLPNPSLLDSKEKKSSLKKTLFHKDLESLRSIYGLLRTKPEALSRFIEEERIRRLKQHEEKDDGCEESHANGSSEGTDDFFSDESDESKSENSSAWS